jgi:acyl-coenzyme A synthetase/AMP-(fatty) acid ligase/acyl carrier protein
MPVLELSDVERGERPRGPLPAQSGVACVLYTSGSTGAPKGVMLGEDMILERVVRANRFGVGPGDRLSALGAGGMNLFRALLTGAALVSLDVRAAGVDALPAWLRDERITLYHSVPTLFRHLAAVLGPDDRFPDLRVVNLTGEALLDQDVEAFRRRFSPECVLVHGLGTTEAGTFHELRIDRDTRVTGRVVPVGFSVEGTAVALLDPDGRRAEPGAIGEIAVRGPHLAIGYRGRPDLTAERFVPDPAGDGARVYRTGDLGRWLPDGSLAHLGRNDEQIKVRGHRVEPGEVESNALQHAAVRQAAVIGRPAPEGTRLIAYVVTMDGAALSSRELRSFLRERLPEPMVPSVVVTLPALPLTPNGKVDRRALPEPVETGAAAGGFVPPRGPLETGVAGIWQEVFSVEAVGAHDDFFAMGGNSLQATRVASRLQEVLGVIVPPGLLFDHPTVAELAAALGHLLAEPSP